MKEILSIKGAWIIPLKINFDDRGSLIEIFKLGVMPLIQQINMCSVNPGVVKGWHLHQKQDDIFVCIGGSGILGMWDTRQGSISQNNSERIHLHLANPELIFIPRGVEHGLACPLMCKDSLQVLELISECYDPEDEIRIPYNAHRFDWFHKNK